MYKNDGFKQKISPEIISHPANCQILLHIDNNKKKSRSSITYVELLERISIWNEKYGVPGRTQTDVKPDLQSGA